MITRQKIYSFLRQCYELGFSITDEYKFYADVDKYIDEDRIALCMEGDEITAIGLAHMVDEETILIDMMKSSEVEDSLYLWDQLKLKFPKAKKVTFQRMLNGDSRYRTYNINGIGKLIKLLGKKL